MFMLSFLAHVSKFKDINKMTSYNMAVVFAPCFLRPKQYTMEDFKE